jgi:tetratricopeptide (TPR) repeat protein
LLVVLASQFSRRLNAPTRMVLAFMAVPVVLLIMLQFYQVRWGLLVGPLYIALAAVLIPQIWHLVPRGGVARGTCALFFGLYGYLIVAPSFKNCFLNNWVQYRAPAGNIQITPEQALALLHRQMAYTIREDAAGQPVVLLSSPNSSSVLAALGGFRTIGTLYWENVEGLRKAARALNAQTDQEIRQLFQQYGVTHVSLMNWENFIEPYFHILHPEVRGADAALQNSFGIRALYGNTIPSMMRPLVFPGSNLTEELKQKVLMLRFAPDQTMEEARLHLARYVFHVEKNSDQAGMLLRDLADSMKVGFIASAELALVYLSQNQHDQAVEYFLKALASPEPLFRQAVTAAAIEKLQRAQRHREAGTIAARAAAAEDATITTLLDAAWFFATAAQVSLRDPARAARWTERAAAVGGADEGAVLLVRGAIAGAEKDYERAAALVAEALPKIPSQSPLHDAASQMAESFRNKQPWIPASSP